MKEPWFAYGFAVWKKFYKFAANLVLISPREGRKKGIR